MFKTIENNSESLLIEKKSKFIGNAFYVSSVQEAEAKIEKIKKMYYDAKHHCFAYRVMAENGIIEKQSDDGEPSGTAGMPILNILQKRDIVNVIIIITRYFGGILLGTGGLLRAYSETANLAMQNAKEIEKERGYVIEMELPYEMQKKFEYYCEKNDINIISKEYTNKVKNLIEISEKKFIAIFQKDVEKEFDDTQVIIKDNRYINKTK